MAEPNLQKQGAWLSVPYAIYTGTGPGNDGIDGSLGHMTGNQLTFAIQVNADDVFDALWEILGEYKWDIGSGRLNRIPPRVHPKFNWLHATRAGSVRPYKLTGKENLITGAYPSHRFYLLSLLFQQLRHPVMTDAELDRRFPPVDVAGTAVRQEWYRWVEWQWTDATETLSREGGTSFTFVEGPVAGQPFPAPIGQHLGKPDLLGVWRNVPYRGLFSPTTRRPERLLTALNTVNSSTFMNCEAGTLLFRGFTFTFNESPYPPDNVNVDPGNQGVNMVWPSLSVDVSLRWSYFRPPPGTVNYRGHNTAPYRGDNLWYLITTDGTAGGATIYPATRHELIFTYSA